MALPEVEILNKLKNFADLTAFVQDRVNASNEVAQGQTYPCVNFFEVSGGSVSSFAGSSGLGYGRYQFNCWSPNYAESRKIRDAVRRALTGVRTLDQGGVLHTGIVEGKMDMPRLAGSKNYQCVIDISIWYGEAQ